MIDRCRQDEAAVAWADPLGGGQLEQAHRAACVQLLGADTDLRAEPDRSPSVDRVKAFTITAALSQVATNRWL
ncbi:hypothetical protein I6A81_40735 [Frankia sp. CN7]|uniref:Uncharacterized protein n=1 Tax=Frankia nepalensis TaxID=1836974 RepID=A0A937R8C5_9ACTN|nr:hypothetical protein [Frankia nepalensis]MBL7516324.1 hypothetical protein [Frankia nepalensis]MBL7625760.1 hypothetical protein [Frankia nepalensis]